MNAEAKTEAPAQQGQAEAAREGRQRLALSSAVVSEALFIGVVTAFFIYLMVASSRWPASAAFLPRLGAIVGLLTLLYHLADRLRQGGGRRAEGSSQILDIGFDTAEADPQVVRARTLRMVGSLAGLLLGVWLVGFHLALPLYVLSQLAIYGKVRWWWASVGALVFVGIIVGLFDQVLHVTWNTPVLWRWLGVDLPWG